MVPVCDCFVHRGLGDPVRVARHVFPNGSMTFAGYEILTYTIDGVGSFRLDAHFLCVGGTPAFCGFSEEGKLVPDAELVSSQR